ncbi:histidine kinase [Peptostreptococcus sp. MV1]|uniref:sensor histidine kinase n=1 Tax=Peptostreptococcus sp. MV1 TaxID=1219626 RepID=UPI00050F8762|nr:HAMP domain-containing sensor histidine kinase [Peptostreptococcus sp. MV1]KGF15639.1 histidine kinase [Peptostreptococcus sp. MV1]
MGLHFGGLRKKVLKNFIIIIVLIVVIFEVFFAIFTTRYYYTSIRQTMLSQIRYIDTVYNASNMSNIDFNDRVRSILENQNSFQNTNVAINVIDRHGNLLIDQYGFNSNKTINYVDVKKALKNIYGSEMNTYIYEEDLTRENVMSASVPIRVNGITQGVIRFSVSLKYVNMEILKIMTYLFFMGLLVIVFSITLSLKFADSIIDPLHELKLFSNMLAKGNYNIKMNKGRISDDEIGDLANTFENMAQEIQKSEKLKDEFISSVSHELRTPLTSIKGWSETLELDNISKEELSMGLGIINDETERLIKLVEELLDFSRLSSNRMKLKVVEVNIENLVASVVNQLRAMAMNKNIRLSFEFLNQDMKLIYGDKDRLRQVLINLVQNSIKFTPDGGVISVKVDQTSNETSICVIDNGIGIDEKNIGNVSKKFFQEDFHKSGSGLGLAISEEIVKLHGGSLTINSKKNVGTQITITISNDSRKS